MCAKTKNGARSRETSKREGGNRWERNYMWLASMRLAWPKHPGGNAAARISPEQKKSGMLTKNIPVMLPTLADVLHASTAAKLGSGAAHPAVCHALIASHLFV